MGKVLLDGVGQAVVAPSELAQEVAAFVVADGDVGAFEFGAAEGVPRV